jgi:uncharacterized protein (TIGR00725 family)
MIAVVGSHRDEHVELAEPLGHWLAESGYHLVTGGGPGVAQATCRAFASVKDRAGLVVGIIPGHVDARDGYRPSEAHPNPWVELAIYTHLPHAGERGGDPMSRNHITILSSHAVIVLPGTHGTMIQMQLALKYQRPVISLVDNAQAFGPRGPEMDTSEMLRGVQQFIAQHCSDQPHPAMPGLARMPSLADADLRRHLRMTGG